MDGKLALTLNLRSWRFPIISGGRCFAKWSNWCPLEITMSRIAGNRCNRYPAWLLTLWWHWPFGESWLFLKTTITKIWSDEFYQFYDTFLVAWLIANVICRFTPCASLIFLFSNRFHYLVPLCCNFLSWLLSCSVQVGANIYKMKLFVPLWARLFTILANEGLGRLWCEKRIEKKFGVILRASSTLTGPNFNSTNLMSMQIFGALSPSW